MSVCSANSGRRKIICHTDINFVLFADVLRRQCHVRFAPSSGHSNPRAACPLDYHARPAFEMVYWPCLARRTIYPLTSKTSIFFTLRSCQRQAQVFVRVPSDRETSQLQSGILLHKRDTADFSAFVPRQLRFLLKVQSLMKE